MNKKTIPHLQKYSATHRSAIAPNDELKTFIHVENVGHVLQKHAAVR